MLEYDINTPVDGTTLLYNHTTIKSPTTTILVEWVQQKGGRHPPIIEHFQNKLLLLVLFPELDGIEEALTQGKSYT